MTWKGLIYRKTNPTNQQIELLLFLIVLINNYSYKYMLYR